MKYFIISFIFFTAISNNVLADNMEKSIESIGGFYGGGSVDFDVQNLGGDGVFYNSTISWKNNENNFLSKSGKIGFMYGSGVADMRKDENISNIIVENKIDYPDSDKTTYSFYRKNKERRIIEDLQNLEKSNNLEFNKTLVLDTNSDSDIGNIKKLNDISEIDLLKNKISEKRAEILENIKNENELNKIFHKDEGVNKDRFEKNIVDNNKIIEKNIVIRNEVEDDLKNISKIDDFNHNENLHGSAKKEFNLINYNLYLIIISFFLFLIFLSKDNFLKNKNNINFTIRKIRK